MFAKVKDLTLVKYPYTDADLKEDAPFIEFDNSLTLAEQFKVADSSISDGFSIVDVEIQEPPSFDAGIEELKQASVPSLINEKWMLGWVVIAKADVADPTNP